MVTAPNYSLFTDVTRHDNLHNMKRIALDVGGVHGGRDAVRPARQRRAPTATIERWTDFVAVRDEVSLLAFEFTTGRGRERAVAIIATSLSHSPRRPAGRCTSSCAAGVPHLRRAHARRSRRYRCSMPIRT